MPSARAQSHFQSLRGLQLSCSWYMPGISPYLWKPQWACTEYFEKSLYCKWDIEKNHLAWEPAQRIAWNNGQWPSQVYAAWMGNPSPETAAFLTIPHPPEWIFCSSVLGSALSFVFKSLQEKQINKNHMLSLFEKDPLLIRRCYREGPTYYILWKSLSFFWSFS